VAMGMRTTHNHRVVDSHHCYHQMNPHKVAAMASSTLERLIVDY
jgi:hypothetical protein